MSRQTFYIIAAVFWLVYAGMGALAWPGFIEKFGENGPEYGGAILFFGALVGVFIQALMADWLVVHVEKVKKETEAERLARIERDVQKELKGGGFRRAIHIYESEGFIIKALQLAEKHGDKESMARLVLRLGRHGKAMDLFRELGKLEAAAHTAVLAGKPKEARALYREAAERAPAGTGPAALGGLWNRAGEPERAAPLFDEAGDLRRAAECHEIAGREEEARKLDERAAVVEAYEKRKGGGTSKTATTLDPKKDARDAAEVMATVGDMFGAAEAWRDATDYRKAAEAFEKVEEWERSARCYEKAGDAKRAAELRELASATVRSKPQVPDPPAGTPPSQQSAAQAGSASGNGVAAPALGAPPPMLMAPGSVAVPAFHPAFSQPQQFVPIFASPNVASGQAGATSPAAAKDLAAMFQAGNFAAAANASASAPVWFEAARQLEAQGNFGAAADLYRSMGRIENARSCLERANRPLEAAMLAIAAGDRRGALKALRAMLDKGPNREAGLFLGELFIEAGKHYQALRVLHENLAPEGCNEKNASLFYHFARRFEDAGANAEALALYNEMVAAGATSADISARIEDIKRKGGISDAPTMIDGTKDPRKSAEDFLKVALDDTSHDGPTESKPERKAVAFPFSPPSLRGRFSLSGTAGPTQQKAPPLVQRELSLFGLPPMAEDATAGPTRSAAQRPDPFAPSQRYELVRELGRGGMGVVYEAKDRTLGRSLVIKLIGGAQADARAIEQFLMEARAIARLNHRNIVTIYDFGMMDLQHYIAMEMVRGKDLKSHIAAEGKLPPKDALKLFIQMARGLDAAHKEGVVHRDIKPANILLTEEKEVRIVDFGLAKLADPGRGEGDGDGEKTMYRTAGTPGYMAPEQIQGEELLPACDIYALGMTLFTMIVGMPPHRAAGISGTPAIVNFQLSGNYPKLGQFAEDVPPVVEQIYGYCTKVKREERYQSVDAFLETLEQWAKVL